MSAHSDPIIQQIISYHAEENFQDIINIFQEIALKPTKSSLSNIHLVTWPLPNDSDLKTFAQFVVLHGIHVVYSIGCGTGLLEWLMLKYILNEYGRNIKTDPFKSNSCEDDKFQLIGVEVDSKWWNSSYCPPKFIPLKYYGEDFDSRQPFGSANDMAIFCYFNNLKIFNDYLCNFRGQFVVLIGPISNEQFCAPGPKDLKDNFKELPTVEWSMISCEQFGFFPIDHLAIYRRNSNTSTSITLSSCV